MFATEQSLRIIIEKITFEFDKAIEMTKRIENSHCYTLKGWNCSCCNIKLHNIGFIELSFYFC